jgi:hypothetical protein
LVPDQWQRWWEERKETRGGESCSSSVWTVNAFSWIFYPAHRHSGTFAAPLTFLTLYLGVPRAQSLLDLRLSTSMASYTTYMLMMFRIVPNMKIPWTLKPHSHLPLTSLAGLISNSPELDLRPIYWSPSLTCSSYHHCKCISTFRCLDEKAGINLDSSFLSPHSHPPAILLILPSELTYYPCHPHPTVSWTSCSHSVPF